MKKILVLGSTGSIGTNALDVIRHDKKNFQLVGLTGRTNIKLLEEQIVEFSPKYVCVGFEEDYKRLKEKYKHITFFCGDAGLRDISKFADYDIILTAVSGFIACDATVEAIKREKVIALANKETMVVAGTYINHLLKNYKAKIIPVDSEHSAIFQCLDEKNKDNIKKLIITASGGTFRDCDLEFLKNVKVEDALKHPNWSMGKKITIDSSTLVNKGLEIIEAHELFHIDYDKIETIVHRESVIHSMVEYKDGSIIAQLGVPSMKTPILYAFNYPHRKENSAISFLDLKKYSHLSFEEARNNIFKGIEFGYFAGRSGKTMPAVLNAANEVAVELFLNGKIKFLDIYKIIEEEIQNHKVLDIENDNALEIIKKVDEETRNRVKQKWGK